MGANAKTVLLIDDDQALLDVLSMALSDKGYRVECATDGELGLAMSTDASPHIIISDVNMPKLDGFALCRQLRESGNQIPLILLTSRDDEIDEALGLELGADDYVAKPFSTRILLARVASLLRREQSRAQTSSIPNKLHAQGLELDLERLELRYHEQLIDVTVTEFRLVETLSRRAGIVFSRSKLLDVLRGDDVVVAERIIDTYIRRLRRKFETIDKGFDRIETVVGAGYRWRER